MDVMASANENSADAIDTSVNALSHEVAQLAIAGGKWDDMFSEVLENHALHQFDIIQAANACLTGPLSPKLCSDIRGWEPMQQTLGAMGFKIGNQDPWTLLGLGKDHGPDPSAQLVSQRVELAKLILQVSESGGWSPEDLAKVSKAGSDLDFAAAQCCKEVHDVARKKQKRKPHTLPRWLEVEHRCIDYLHSQLPRAQIALQLSDVHGQYEGLAPVLTADEARNLHTELAMGPGRGVDALCALGNKEVVVWALPEAEAWQRMLAAYSKFVAQGNALATLHVIIPFDIPGTCDTYRDIMDLWSHPLTGNKWNDLITSRFILLDPVEVTGSGKLGPSTQLKSICCVTLAPNGPAPGIPLAPQVLKWKPVLASQDVCHTLVVDFPASHLLHVRKALANWRPVLAVQWDHHTRSPGSDGGASRLMIHGYLMTQGVTAFDAKMSSLDLQKHVQTLECIVGLLGMCQEVNTLMCELTDAKASFDIKPYCTDILLISPRIALIRTEVTHTVWCQLLSNWARSNPSSCPLKLKWRASQHGGRPWAQADLTERQMLSVRAQAKVKLQGRCPGSNPADLETDIRIPGPLGPDAGMLLRATMVAVATETQATLREVTNQVTLQLGDFVLLNKPGTDEPSGTIRIRLGSIQDAKMLERSIQGCVVVINGRRAHVQVSNPMLLNAPGNC